MGSVPVRTIGDASIGDFLLCELFVVCKVRIKKLTKGKWQILLVH